ncbi:MAG: hypothetical protein IKP53_08515 [Candidatus Methanomethylophilaceae archaeon]|nr:hypothetical protein [Candidatus Methanomethylophilaceae archaeon]
MSGTTCVLFHDADLAVSKTEGGWLIGADGHEFGLTDAEARELARRIRLLLSGELDDDCWASVAGFGMELWEDCGIVLEHESGWAFGLWDFDAEALADDLDPDGAQEVEE